MQLTLPVVMPWLLAGTTLAYTIFKDRRAKNEAVEARLHALEVQALTDRLQAQHKLELMQEKVVAAMATVQSTRNLITETLAAHAK